MDKGKAEGPWKSGRKIRIPSLQMKDTEYDLKMRYENSQREKANPVIQSLNTYYTPSPNNTGKQQFFVNDEDRCVVCRDKLVITRQSLGTQLEAYIFPMISLQKFLLCKCGWVAAGFWFNDDIFSIF